MLTLNAILDAADTFISIRYDSGNRESMTFNLTSLRNLVLTDDDSPLSAAEFACAIAYIDCYLSQLID